jgi:hypothetical protein
VRRTHLRVIQHDHAAQDPEQVLQAGGILQVLTLLQNTQQHAAHVTQQNRAAQAWSTGNYEGGWLANTMLSQQSTRAVTAKHTCCHSQEVLLLVNCSRRLPAGSISLLLDDRAVVTILS